MLSRHVRRPGSRPQCPAAPAHDPQTQPGTEAGGCFTSRLARSSPWPGRRRRIRALTEEDSGRLRFTCPVGTGDRMVSELLARFAELCPGVQGSSSTSPMPWIDMEPGENDISPAGHGADPTT